MSTPDVPICLLVGDRNDQSALESLLEPMAGRLQVCDRLDDALKVLAERPGLLIASGMALPPGGLSRLEQLDPPPAVLLLSGEEEGPLLRRQGALDALSGSVPPSVTVLQRPLRPATAETLVRQLSRLVGREPSGPRPVPDTPAEEDRDLEPTTPKPTTPEPSTPEPSTPERPEKEEERRAADAGETPAERQTADTGDEPAAEPAPDPLEERLDEMGIGTAVRSRPDGPIRLSSEVQRLAGLPATTPTLVPLLLQVLRSDRPQLVQQIRAVAHADREDPAAESEAEGPALDVTVRLRDAGSTQWVRVRGQSAGTASREEPSETGWTGLVEDVTAQRRREQQRTDRIEHLRSQVARHSQRVRRIAERLTDAEEEERNRIASVLHDDLQPLIYGAYTQISAWEERLESGEESVELSSESVSAEEEGEELSISERLNQMTTQLRQAMSLMRSLVSRIRPPVLHTSTFAETLEWLSVHVEETLGAELNVDVPDGFDVTGRGRRAFLFEAIREAVFNAVRHGEVRTVKVCGRQSETRSHIVVEDTGAGFDPSSLEQRDQGRGGFGLARIQQRLEDLGGELKIDSAPGIGTRITMTLPRRTEASEDDPAARPSSVES